MNYREFSGKTLEEAIESACSYFNTNTKYLKYEVLKKKKNKNFSPFNNSEIIIKAKPKDIEECTKDKVQIKNIKQISQEEVPLKELTTESNEIVKIIDDILKLTSYEYRLNVIEFKEELKIGVYGPDMKGLIQEDGVGIDSLKHLVGRAITKQFSFSKRLNLDINDFRKEKETYIKKLAHRLSDKAKKTKEPVILNPMNAYDRRIFHLEVESIDGVKTQSVGEGLFKKIKLIPIIK